jgi:tetratricopeptide (TPR) repeat protein/predicted Ser/Thr protein kinase
MDVERQSTRASGGSTSSGEPDDSSSLVARHRKDAIAAALFDEPLATLEVGRYTILRELGVGGMGVVYVAYDEQLDRRVAIKLLRSNSDAKHSVRLQREAKAMARLSHPNVVTVHEVGTHRGQVFVAMEYVDGQDLRAWLTARPRSHREIVAAFIQAGEGLAAAHDVAIVHRDFKPDNVLVGKDGRLRVADFGLSHALGADPTVTPRSSPRPGPFDATLTRTGAMVGTPAYMAPEQFLGRDTDARSDQFAFCVALWEALHGRRPFPGTCVADLSKAVLAGQIREPPRTDVPDWLRKILQRGLARDPDQRWPNMRSLLAALQRDPTRHRRMLVAGLAVLVVVGTTIAGFALARTQSTLSRMASCEQSGRAIEEDWNDDVAATLEQRFAATDVDFAASAWTHAYDRMSEHAQAWSSLRTQVCLETRVEHTRSVESHDRIVECLDERREAFVGLLDAWAAPDRRTVARAVKAAAALAPASTCFDDPSLAERARPPEPLRDEVARLRARLERARGFELTGQYDLALGRALAVLADARTIEWLPIQAEAELVVGKLQSRAGRYEEAVDSYRRSFRAAAGAGDDLGMLQATIQLTVDTGYYLAQPDESRWWAELGELLLDRLDLAETIHAAALHNSIGVVDYARGDYASALEHYREALAIKESRLGAEHYEVAGSLVNIGIVHIDLGDDAGALEHFGRALAIQESVLGPQHLDLAATRINRGIVLTRLGRFDEARADLERALAIQEATLGRDHIDVATTLTNLGNLWIDQGQLDQALAAQERALEIQEATLGADHPDVAITLNNLGDVRFEQGAHAEARELYRRALSVQEAALGLDHVALAYPLTGLGSAELALGELDSARVHLERAVALRESGGEAQGLATSRDLLDRVNRAAEASREVDSGVP